MNIQPAIMHPLQPRPRFGARLGVDGFRKTLKDNGNGEVFIKAKTEDAPPTRMRRAWQKLGRGLAAFTMLGASVAGVGAGWKTGGNYLHAKKDVAPLVSLNKKIGTSWTAVADVAHTAEATRAVDDVNLRGEYNDRMEGFLVKFVQTMRENPGRLDQELVRQLERNYDFMPRGQAHDIAPSFVRFMEKELQDHYGVTPELAGRQHVQNIDILNGYVNQEEAFNSLSAKDKAQLADTLKALYWEHHTFIQPSYFTDTISGALSTGIKGATLDDFARLTDGASAATEEDAKALFAQIINNNENFSQLSDGQREALIERGTEMLDALEFDSPSPLWGLSAVALLLAGLGGAGFSVATRRRQMAELFTQVPADMWNGLKHPVLVVNQADNSPEAQNALSIIVSEISANARAISQLIQQAYDADPQVKDILDKEYQGQLPDENKVLGQFIFNAYEQVMAKRSLQEKLQETPIDELAFLQQLQLNLESALSTGDVLDITLPKGMVQADQRPEGNANASPIEVLRIAQLQVEYDLREARRILSNRVMGQMQGANALAEARAKLADVQEAFIALNDKGASGDEITNKRFQMEVQEKIVESAEASAEELRLLLMKAKLLLTSRIRQLQEHQLEITKAFQNNAFADAFEALEQIQNEAKNVMEDNGLQEIIDKMELDALIAKEKADLDKMEREVDAEIEAAVAKSKALKAGAAHAG